MQLYGDPDAIDALAKELRTMAARLRDSGQDHVRLAENTEWISSAADACRARIHEDQTKLDAAAAGLEDAAAALAAHAQEVREIIAKIAEIEESVRGWFADQANVVRTKVESFVDAAGDLMEKVVHLEPPWAHWPVGPHNLPAQGSKEWLQTGQFMRKVGVL